MTTSPERPYGASGSAPGPAWHPHTGGPVDPAPFHTPPPLPVYTPPQQGRWGQPEDRMPDLQPTSPPARFRYADWGERVGAGLVDWGLALAALLTVSTLTGFSDTLSTLGGFVWLGLIGYVAWLNGSKGQSPGKALMGLKLVRDVDGSTLGGPVGVVRALVLGVLATMTGGLFLVLSVLWPLWGQKKQALHDKIVSASVIAGHPKAKLGKGIFQP